MQELIEAKRFTFTAQSVSPFRGPTRQLTSEYELRVSPDTLRAYLPYFGRAHVAPMNPTEGGIRFTSIDFSYSADPQKRGRWNVLLAPRDTDDVRQMQLSVSEDGYASLRVISNNRDPISFNGVVSSPVRR